MKKTVKTIKRKSIALQPNESPKGKRKRKTVLKQNNDVSQTETVLQRVNKKFLWLLLFGLCCIVLGVLSIFRSVEIGMTALQVTKDSASQTLLNPVLKQTNNRTNILFLGVGGENHEASDLTDTIQIISFPLSGDQQSTMLSLPRDVWSVTLQDRINTAYYYGKEQNRPGGGMGFAKQIIEEVTGLPIHYTVVIDFQGFKEVVDAVGGIEVRVSRSFSDATFPIAGRENDDCGGDVTLSCRYTTVEFKEGVENMDGERALTYVRSRYAKGEEGTDFSRGRRQQEVIEALIQKMKKPQEWVNEESYDKLMRILNTFVLTDIQQHESLSLLRFLVAHGLLSSPKRLSIESELINPNPNLYGGKYVLVPTTSIEHLHDYIEASVSGNKN